MPSCKFLAPAGVAAGDPETGEEANTACCTGTLNCRLCAVSGVARSPSGTLNSRREAKFLGVTLEEDMGLGANEDWSTLLFGVRGTENCLRPWLLPLGDCGAEPWSSRLGTKSMLGDAEAGD
eukprot:CAMPEP_0173472054 /NCGR_PEP_ID=MMETSP1357-20121228/78707_1 /TAXON_ID=77926 /ORGANISM="Hemiselmis rufescens, Strain PCC563" /LENGTH=121 /DNA_ID=CAMNT_0014440373 /DNA_START=267 /DNA_END=632 /DNA_ORIENTATION=+